LVIQFKIKSWSIPYLQMMKFMNSNYSMFVLVIDKALKSSFFFGSGDHDMCVPYTGTEAWTRSLGYKIVDEWRPWLINNQIAGYPLFFHIAHHKFSNI